MDTGSQLDQDGAWAQDKVSADCVTGMSGCPEGTDWRSTVAASHSADRQCGAIHGGHASRSLAMASAPVEGAQASTHTEAHSKRRKKSKRNRSSQGRRQREQKRALGTDNPGSGPSLRYQHQNSGYSNQETWPAQTTFGNIFSWKTH